MTPFYLMNRSNGVMQINWSKDPPQGFKLVTTGMISLPPNHQGIMSYNEMLMDLAKCQWIQVYIDLKDILLENVRRRKA